MAPTQSPPHHVSPAPPAREQQGITGEVMLTGRVIIVGAAEPPCAAPLLGVDRHGDRLASIRGHPHAQPTRHGHPVTQPRDADPCRHHSGWLGTARHRDKGGDGDGDGDGMRTQDPRISGSRGQSLPPPSPLCRYGCPSGTATPFTEMFRPRAATVSIPKVMCSVCGSAVSARAGSSCLQCVPGLPGPPWLLAATDAQGCRDHAGAHHRDVTCRGDRPTAPPAPRATVHGGEQRPWPGSPSSHPQNPPTAGAASTRGLPAAMETAQVPSAAAARL